MPNSAAPAKPSRNEGLKEASPTLAGTIARALADNSTDHFTEDDYEFLKFHGAYQQDDRDKRKVAREYSLMVRTKFPGGVLTGPQYLVCDQLATQYGNNTLRITTRQDFQFHGILKSNLRETIRLINSALMTTLAACGDVTRNVLASPIPATSPVVEEVLREARILSEKLAPKTPAYASIWLNGAELDLKNGETFTDPIYGKTYLPRKFKFAFAIPPRNDVDIFTNDLGLIVIVENGSLAGYNIVAGGGMGMSHNNPLTFPRLADVIGFIPVPALEAVAKAAVSIHKDFGDRTNRKHARLKYVLQERGADWFRAELQKRSGVAIEPARPFEFTRQGDLFGWHTQTNGNLFLGLFVENGRIRNQDGYQLKTALHKVVEQFMPEVRLTASQNLILSNIRPSQRSAVEGVLAQYGVHAANPFSQVRLGSMACPALPTCGLALAESERFMPDLLTRMEGLLTELGLQQEELVVRMTGCPNGCARPYMAEIAFVGKAPNKYQIYLGGNISGTRLNRLFKDSVKGDDLLNELRPVLARYRQERQPNEGFGDFCARVIWTETARPA